MTGLRLLIFATLIFICGCGTHEDRQENRQLLKDGLSDHQIKRVTEDQIVKAAYDHGSSLIQQLDGKSKDIAFWQTAEGHMILDSINGTLGHGGLSMVLIDQDPQMLRAEEISLIEAYEYSFSNDQQAQANVQDVEGQHLLYTSPVNQDSKFLGMWSFFFSRKSLVRNL